MKQTLRLSLGFIVVMAWFACRQPAHTQNTTAMNLSQATEEKNAKEASDDIGCLDPKLSKPQTISLGALNSRAINIPKPAYPPAAKNAKLSGQVAALVVVDERGQVIWARVLTGHPLLQAAVKTVVCQARLKPFKVAGHFVKTNGVITYKFELP